MNINEHLHPYIDDEIDNIGFTYIYKNDHDIEIKVKTPNNTKTEKTVETFAIEKVYNAHPSELRDMLRTREYFSDKYLSILQSHVLNNQISSKEELYRLAFGSELKNDNFVNRPLSKFKHDILKELGII